MPGGKSQWLEQSLLNFLYRGASFTPPASTYLALSGSPWDPTLDGSGLTEPAAGAYARVAIASSGASWAAAAGAGPAQLASLATVTFPTATADWGLIAAVYLCTAASGGNVMHGSDVAPTAVGPGTTVAYQAGQLAVRET